MEALHVATIKANAQGIFKGCATPGNGPTVSHLLYADDVLFVGEWSDSNLLNLARLLRCFHLSSGLKVNFNKSQLFGVGVPPDIVESKATILQCKTGAFPFTYLGLPVGANMGLVKSWKPVIQRFEEKLTLWKARTLSFGGRVTLIEAVLGNLPTYYLSLFNAPIQVIKQLEKIRRKFLWGGCLEKNKISWVPWFKVVAPKKDGGLGIGSLASTNKALMTKWCVRFKNENDSLWARVISAIHGGPRCQNFIPLKSSIGGVWKSIVNMGRLTHNQPFKVQDRLTPKVGNGDKILFWQDKWVGDRTLRERFPNIYAMESEKGCKVSDRYKVGQHGIEWFWGSNNELTNEDMLCEWTDCISVIKEVKIQEATDVWLWKTGSDTADFMVKTIRGELDHINVLNETKVLKWLHWIPKKVNCFLWRVVLDRIATKEALQIRRINLASLQCVLCNNAVESVNHLLITCETAQLVWSIIFQWVNLPTSGYILSVVQLLETVNSHSWHKKIKRAIYVVVAATCWNLWIMRNEYIFKNKAPNITKLIGNIKANSYMWIKNRAGLQEITWEKWKGFTL
ncbi:putative RNA-directed DNA polymerase [Helianthus annuus]|nr:putative RNA-directed DNA polymerase [Helianthus annuus]